MGSGLVTGELAACPALWDCHSVLSLGTGLDVPPCPLLLLLGWVSPWAAPVAVTPTTWHSRLVFWEGKRGVRAAVSPFTP